MKRRLETRTMSRRSRKRKERRGYGTAGTEEINKVVWARLSRCAGRAVPPPPYPLTSLPPSPSRLPQPPHSTHPPYVLSLPPLSLLFAQIPLPSLPSRPIPSPSPLPFLPLSLLTPLSVSCTHAPLQVPAKRYVRTYITVREHGRIHSHHTKQVHTHPNACTHVNT